MEFSTFHMATGNRRFQLDEQFEPRSYGEMMKNKIRVKNRSRTVIALFYCGKFIGINPFTLTTNNYVQSSRSSVFYVFILVFCIAFIFYNSWIERMHYLMPSETPISVIVDCGLQSSMYLEVLFAWFTNHFHKDRLIKLIEAFEKAEQTSEKLDIPENYEESLIKLAIYLAVTNTIFFSAVAYSNVVLTYYSDYNIRQWIFFNIPRVVPICFMTLFIWCLLIVKKKFCRLNKQLCLLIQNYCVKSRENSHHGQSINVVTFQNLSRHSTLLSDRIIMISQSHRQLRDLIHRVVEHFALVIVFQITTQLTSLTFDIYAIYRYVKTHELIRPVDFLFVSCFGVIMSSSVMIFAIGSNVCGSVSYEANNTGNIVHSILNNSEYFFDTQEAAELNVLSLDLLKNKTRISVFGLFCIDHFFIYETLAKVATYLVIMLQFYD